MPIPTNDSASSSALPEKVPLAQNETDDNDAVADDDGAPEVASDVAKRISLLGKLIIPPTAP